MDFFTVLWSFYVRNDIQDAKLEEQKIKSTQNINPLEALSERKNERATQSQSTHTENAKRALLSLFWRTMAAIATWYVPRRWRARS